MKKIIDKIHQNAFLTFVTAIILGAVVFFLSKITAKPFNDLIESQSAGSFYTKNTVFKFFMLVYSVIFILLVNRWSLKNYGFQKPLNINYGKFFLRVVGIAIGAVIVGSIVFMGILSHVFPTENTKTLPMPDSLFQMIITVWIWSSICEEVLVRGLVQGFMQSLQGIKIISRLSLPVVVSGLFLVQCTCH